MTAVALHAPTPTLSSMEALAGPKYSAEELERLDLPRIADALDNAARATGVPVTLLVAVAFVESKFDARLIGHDRKGRPELGLMQLLPRTAVEMASRPDVLVEGWELLPEVNALLGARYLASRKGRSWREKLVRYAGAGPRARAYSARVLAVAARIERRQGVRS